MFKKRMLNEEAILNALRKVMDPDLHTDIVSLGFVKDVAITDGKVSFTLELTTPACPVRDQLLLEARRTVLEIPGVKDVDVKMTSQVVETPTARKEKMLPDVKNIIPVASGKGGVGKSTVSVNVALALSLSGSKVGLLDADIYGPSIPQILGVTYEPQMNENNKIIPAKQYGIKVMSMGFFLTNYQAAIWRGPMLAKMVEQFISSVEWGELDYLIVDLPPGTGDIQLSLCQLIPLTGAVIVSTPQDVALNVARKAILMFGQLHTPILGIIENMSYYTCPQCGHTERIFGEGGGAKVSQEFGIPFIGEIPLARSIREQGDTGKPVVFAEPQSDIAKAFISIAETLAAKVSIQNLAQKNLTNK